jgi:dolichol kinase
MEATYKNVLIQKKSSLFWLHTQTMYRNILVVLKKYMVKFWLLKILKIAWFLHFFIFHITFWLYVASKKKMMFNTTSECLLPNLRKFAYFHTHTHIWLFFYAYTYTIFYTPCTPMFFFSPKSLSCQTSFLWDDNEVHFAIGNQFFMD